MEETTKVITALSINDDLVVFRKAEVTGLFLGKKSNYKKYGEYKGELVKLSNSDNFTFAYILNDLLKLAEQDNQENNFIVSAIFRMLQDKTKALEILKNSIDILLK